MGSPAVRIVGLRRFGQRGWEWTAIYPTGERLRSRTNEEGEGVWWEYQGNWLMQASPEKARCPNDKGAALAWIGRYERS